MALRTAKAWGRPPHAFWQVRGDDWTSEDYLIAQAFELLDMMRCGCGCGGWEDECLNDDMQDEWEVRTRVHHRKRLIEEYRAENKAEVQAPGVTPYLVDLRTEE